MLQWKFKRHQGGRELQNETSRNEMLWEKILQGKTLQEFSSQGVGNGRCYKVRPVDSNAEGVEADGRHHRESHQWKMLQGEMLMADIMKANIVGEDVML